MGDRAEGERLVVPLSSTCSPTKTQKFRWKMRSCYSKCHLHQEAGEAEEVLVALRPNSAGVDHIPNGLAAVACLIWGVAQVVVGSKAGRFAAALNWEVFVNCYQYQEDRTLCYCCCHPIRYYSVVDSLLFLTLALLPSIAWEHLVDY